MKIIKPSATIVPIEDMSRLKMMEMCGRICYRSEDKIDDESAESFVRGVFRKKHWSVSEFAIHTMNITVDNQRTMMEFCALDLKYLLCTITGVHTMVVTGTTRAWREIFQRYSQNDVISKVIEVLFEKYPYFFDDVSSYGFQRGETVFVKQIPNPGVLERSPLDLMGRHTWVMVKYIVNRAVSHELVRHRPVSWLQESQRYCRYSEDKFGSEVTFIKPMFFEHGSDDYVDWYESCAQAEATYFRLLKNNSPQASRTVLPNSCKTELVQLCNLEEWKIFFGLRTSPAAEPSMREITIPLYSEFKKKWPAIFA